MSRKKTTAKTPQRRVEPLPPGEYAATVRTARTRKTEQGEMIELTYSISDGDHASKLSPSANAKQVDGGHYKGDTILIEPWDYCMANQLDGMQYNIIKYVTRWPDKGGVRDLEKVVHYLEKYIEILKAGIPLPTNKEADPEKYAEYLAGLIKAKAAQNG